jgi:RNA polymerase sigma factor (sigma-70 family)
VDLPLDQQVAPQELAAADATACDIAGPDADAPAPDRDRDCDEDGAERFARLVVPHLAEAYTLARWITGDAVDAEDVVQDACLRAFRAVATAGDFNARAWTLGAVRSAAFAWLRKYRPAALVPPEEFGPFERERMRAWEQDADTPESALIAKTDLARLEAAIARLPAPFREALVLRDIHGLSYREIAAHAGVPIGTVMSRLARGRARLVTIIVRGTRLQRFPSN